MTKLNFFTFFFFGDGGLSFVSSDNFRFTAIFTGVALVGMAFVGVALVGVAFVGASIGVPLSFVFPSSSVSLPLPSSSSFDFFLVGVAEGDFPFLDGNISDVSLDFLNNT
jgi:hypothetical protein